MLSFSPGLSDRFTRSPTHTGNRNSTPARMAESVDALVSNTSGAIRAGSIPAPGTTKCKCLIFQHLHFSFSFLLHVCTTKWGHLSRSPDIFTSHPQKPPFSWTAVDFTDSVHKNDHFYGQQTSWQLVSISGDGEITVVINSTSNHNAVTHTLSCH